jgi:hypothetical protein
MFGIFASFFDNHNCNSLSVVEVLYESQKRGIEKRDAEASTKTMVFLQRSGEGRVSSMSAQNITEVSVTELYLAPLAGISCKEHFPTEVEMLRY